MNNWQPIETAPKDDRPMLVYLSEPMLGSRVHTARFNKNGVGTIGSVFAFDAPKPTHWQPLPEPPHEK